MSGAPPQLDLFDDKPKLNELHMQPCPESLLKNQRFAFIKSMHTDQFNHAPAELFIYTGSPLAGGAAMGSWITYGLGSESQDLPGFVVLISGGADPTGGQSRDGAALDFSARGLPSSVACGDGDDETAHSEGLVFLPL
jgi:hypothetical protein